MKKKLNVAVVGLGFGSSFVGIHHHHPDVNSVSIYDPDYNKCELMTQRYKLHKVYNSFEEILNDDSIDAVHLVSPIPNHEEQTVQVLESGKHCACTVPMALSLDGIQKIIDTVNTSGKNYMAMETAVYTTNFLHVQNMIENDEFGKIQFVRGAHYQDMENWPSYWMGLPPMYYGTHAISPLVLALKSPIIKVHCFGSGVMRKELHKQYNNPYPIESAIFEFENGVKGEVTRSLFALARDYTESFNIYGDKSTFEWQQIESDENPVIFTTKEPKDDARRGIDMKHEYVQSINRIDLLPDSIAGYTVKNKYYDETNPQISFEHGGGHGGSHPHMVHEFIRSIIEERKPLMNELVTANIVAAGICAHESAMNHGKEIIVPDFNCFI